MVGQPAYCAAMFPPFQPLQLLLLIFAGWANRRQLDVIEYLQEENSEETRQSTERGLLTASASFNHVTLRIHGSTPRVIDLIGTHPE
jgi:hypothetical protein